MTNPMSSPHQTTPNSTSIARTNASSEPPKKVLMSTGGAIRHRLELAEEEQEETDYQHAEAEPEAGAAPMGCLHAVVELGASPAA